MDKQTLNNLRARLTQSKHVEVVLDLFGTSQTVLVHQTLLIQALLDQVIKKMERDQVMDSVDHYILRLHDEDLSATLTIGQLLQAHPSPKLELSLQRIRPSQTERIGGQFDIVLQESTTHVDIPIVWQPAVIGRSKTSDLESEVIALDVTKKLENVDPEIIRTVSGRHAQLLEIKENYYIENISGTGKQVLVHRGEEIQEVAPKQRYEIKDGDRVQLGRLILLFTLRSRKS